ncbi:MAG TPA: DUF2306 domain-containing protein [Burkholderiales bacterium]|nr:DUF2306 domain-containing protein [Burkholderiales bacterium]
MIALHIVAAVLALIVGAAMLARTKGTASHRLLGRLWVALMLAVTLSSFWIVELRDGARLSVVHLLSAWTLIALALAVYFIYRGNVRAHRGFMIGCYFGLVGAGLGALAPGRTLHLFFFA